ncbi:class I tRNA ligase family protein, partial [Patescibacteria group bacterium]|nr:class I tRNA ligase family protein [Patescibacteria group bacterium]
MKKYDHKKIEKKHQQNWEKDGAYNTKEDKNKQKYYCLVEFPYASGEGLHVGHVRGYTALDIIARKKRMEGFNVLYPIGLDAFGLPTENYAIKTGINPKIIIRDIANTFRRQLKSLGFSFDWSREINTSDPEYYKWTQWIFLQFFKHGFAYKKKMPINWCVDCKIGLANEEVINGVCERCGGQVEKKEKEQWMLAITKYADRLYDDLDKTEFLEKIKVQQRNWIGRSSGVLISFALATTQIGADKKPQINADGKIVLITNVQEFRENVNIDSKLKIEGREFSIKELIKFKLDDGSFYLKLFLSGGYVLADDLNSNSFILVKEKDTNLKIEEDDITFENKKYSFSYKAHAIAEEVFGEEIFKKGESETFWDYTSGNNYLSLGIVDKNKKRLDFLGKTIKADKIEVTNLRESASNLRSSATFTKVNVFTTRPDTLFGATYLVLAPEHELIRKMLDDRSIENKKEVEKYISETAKKKDIDRMAENKIKTGVELKGIKAINPAYRQAGPLNKKEIPVFIADYVLDSYGTGAIMAVPAHDERDYAFASQINADNKTQMGADNKTSADRIEIIKVIESDQNLYTGYGKLINSGKFNGMESEKAMKEITKFVGGELKTIYSLRDWIFSRQRYWGEPIPLVFCNECKKRVGNSKFQIPNSKKIPNSKLQIQNQEFNKGELLNPGWVIDEKLPFELPDVKKYEPTDTGESPLASVKKWVNVKCPKCGADAKRETDTMPNWA